MARLEELLIGASLQMREVRRLVARFGPTPLPVLVTGATGVGKGLVAQALHESSRRTGEFVPANVAALGDGLVESELFGHVRGAFTSATGSRRGLAKQAHGGTLFLDEIHRLSPVAQPKLLRAVETKMIRPVGSDSEARADFRVIAAANEDLRTLVDAGRFQADLLARLSRLVIHVPPLGEHREDIPLLAERFVRALEGFATARFTQSGFDALMEHDWPWNVRELQVVVERACVLAEHPIIDRAAIQSAMRAGLRHERTGESLSTSPYDCRECLTEREHLLRSTLKNAGGKVRLAAAQLGVSRMTLYRWMTELGIATPERRRRRSAREANSRISE